MYNYNLTEEIARWAFEIKCIESEDWFVAFTNPTAGPWKTIKGLDDEGKEGEVYRFGSKEPRPDIVLVSDRLAMRICIPVIPCFLWVVQDAYTILYHQSLKIL